MTQIAVLNGGSALKNIDAAFLAEAVNNQMAEFCRDWHLDAWPVVLYASAAGLPAEDIYIFEYVDQLDQPGALAYHSVDALGRPYARMLPPADPLDASDLSHEALETRGDPTCDRWVKMPDGTELAVEVCDPVQGAASEYSVAVTVLGETRQIKLSDYAMPSLFDELGKAPFSRQGGPTRPFGMAAGGYEAIIDPSGNEHDVYARLRYASLAGAASVHRKLADPGSRVLRRLRGKRAA